MQYRFKAVLVLFSLILATFAPVALAQDNITCSLLGTNEAVDTAFVNDLGFDITSHWVNDECVETEGSFIAAGDTYPAGTYDGHEFIFRDAAGNFVAYYLASTTNSGGEVLLSEYTVAPAWLPEETGSDVKTLITLVPIDEAVRPTADCSIETGGEITTTFWNDTGTDNEIYLYWLNQDCVEEELYVYPDDFYYDFYSTWVGHDIVFRNAAGELLAYYKISEADSEAWTPLSTIITVEKTTVEVEALDSETHIKNTVDPVRTENGIAPIVVNEQLKSLAQAIAPRFVPDDSGFLENVGGASVYGLVEDGLAGELATELGIELSGFQGLVVTAAGLTEENIAAVLDVTLAYEGWGTAEIGSFAVYREGDVFILLATDAVPVVEDDEEWAEFTHPDDAALGVVENVTGTFTADGDIIYPFDAVEGTLYVLYYRSADFDTYLYLNDPQGNEIAVNDDSGGNLNSLIVFTASTSGTYTARLESFTESPKGEYAFTIAQPNAETRGAVAVSAPLELDLEVVSGVTYFAEVSSSEVDTTLAINDAAGNQVTANDDYNGTTNSFVFFTAAETGTYKLVVDSFNSASAGRVRLLTGLIE